jgi:hypothetical protein
MVIAGPFDRARLSLDATIDAHCEALLWSLILMASCTVQSVAYSASCAAEHMVTERSRVFGELLCYALYCDDVPVLSKSSSSLKA